MIFLQGNLFSLFFFVFFPRNSRSSRAVFQGCQCVWGPELERCSDPHALLLLSVSGFVCSALMSAPEGSPLGLGTGIKDLPHIMLWSLFEPCYCLYQIKYLSIYRYIIQWTTVFSLWLSPMQINPCIARVLSSVWALVCTISSWCYIIVQNRVGNVSNLHDFGFYGRTYVPISYRDSYQAHVVILNMREYSISGSLWPRDWKLHQYSPLLT
jgi:hypothetical protein